MIELSSILIIDDTRQDRVLLSGILTSAGHLVFAAGDGAAGLDLCRDKKPAVVLVDIMMPEMNGIDVLKKIKEEMRETKVLLCTGAGSGSMVDLAMRLGADGYIVKPYDADRIHMGIQRALGLK